MKLRLLSSFAAAILAVSAFAQTPAAQETFIKGDLSIRYSTREGEKVREGVSDLYTLNLNVSNSAVFKGTIEARPFISNTMSSNQMGQLTYTMDLDVVNPKNPTQTRNVGKLFGTVPVDEKNVYKYSEGNLKVNVLSVGTAKEFESKFGGLALAKPPANSGFFSGMKQDALKISRSVRGKAQAMPITKWDKMSFDSHVIAAGPVQIYPETTFNGTMIYDEGRAVWWFQGVTVSYVVDGKRIQDTLSGNIRWVESPNRKVNGEGEYQFDIRVNEPPPSEGAVFTQASDESAFFETDNTLSSLIGTMKYKDRIAAGKVLSSAIMVDLRGSNLTKQQTMYLAKMLFLTAVVPLNSE